MTGDLEARLREFLLGSGWMEDSPGRRLMNEAADALRRLSELEQAARQIADPSYVGSYDAEQIVAIYRKWARAALSEAGGSPHEVVEGCLDCPHPDFCAGMGKCEIGAAKAAARVSEAGGSE